MEKKQSAPVSEIKSGGVEPNAAFLLLELDAKINNSIEYWYRQHRNDGADEKLTVADVRSIAFVWWSVFLRDDLGRRLSKLGRISYALAFVGMINADKCQRRMDSIWACVVSGVYSWPSEDSAADLALLQSFPDAPEPIFIDRDELGQPRNVELILAPEAYEKAFIDEVDRLTDELEIKEGKASWPKSAFDGMSPIKQFQMEHNGFGSFEDPLTKIVHSDRLFCFTRAARGPYDPTPCVQIIAHEKDGQITRGVFATRDLPRFSFIAYAEGNVYDRETRAAEFATLTADQEQLFRENEVPLLLPIHRSVLTTEADLKVMSPLNENGSVELKFVSNPCFYVRRSTDEKKLNCTLAAWSKSTELLQARLPLKTLKQATELDDLCTILLTTTDVQKGEELTTISWSVPRAEVQKTVDVQLRFLTDNTLVVYGHDVYRVSRQRSSLIDFNRPLGKLQNTYSLDFNIAGALCAPTAEAWADECGRLVAWEAANLQAMQFAGQANLPLPLPYVLSPESVESAVAMLQTRSGALEDRAREAARRTFRSLRHTYGVFVRLLFHFEEALYEEMWDLANIRVKKDGLPRASAFFKSWHFDDLFGPKSTMPRNLKLQFQRLLVMRYKRPQLENILRMFSERRVREYKNQQGALYSKVRSGEIKLQKGRKKAASREHKSATEDSETARKAGVRAAPAPPDGKQSSATYDRWEFVPAETASGPRHRQNELVDDILAYMLATLEPVPAEFAENMDRSVPEWFLLALQARIERVEKQIKEHKAKIAIQRTGSTYGDLKVSPSQLTTDGYFLPKPSKQDLVLIDFLHHQSALLARMKALVSRFEARGAYVPRVAIMNDMSSFMEYVASISERETKRVARASTTPSPLVLNVARDEFGNVFTFERSSDVPRASLDVKDGDNAVVESPQEDRAVYRDRADMLADLQADLECVDDQIALLVAEERKENKTSVAEELSKLRFKRAEVLEMIAEVHGQTEAHTPRLRVNRRASGRRAEFDKWHKRDEALRNEIRKRWDRGGDTATVVSLIEERLTAQAMQLPEKKTVKEMIAAAVKVWLGWDSHIRPIGTAHGNLDMDSIPRGSLRHYFLNYQHLLTWLLQVFAQRDKSHATKDLVEERTGTAAAVRKAIQPFQEQLDKVARAQQNVVGSTPEFLQLRSNRTLEHCINDLLFIMMNLSHALVNRYRTLRDWVSSPYFATLPRRVVLEQAQAVLLFAHVSSDEALVINPDQTINTLAAQQLEEASAVWNVPAERFSSKQAADEYKTRSAEFLSRLAKFNRRGRLWIAWLYDVTEEFAMFKLVQESKLDSPMDTQLLHWETASKIELMRFLSDEARSPFVHKDVRELAEKLLLEHKPRLVQQQQRVEDDWDRLPQPIRLLLPVHPLGLVEPTEMCAWGMTAEERGDYAYMDFTRAHLMTQTPPKAFEGDQGYAYARLIEETSSPTAFARKRELEAVERADILKQLRQEAKRTEGVRAAMPAEFKIDKQQANVMAALVHYMLRLENDRHVALQTRFNILAKALSRVNGKSEASNYLIWLSGTPYVVVDEWNAEAIPNDLRSPLHTVCNEINRLSSRLAGMSALYRLHAEQLKLPMTLDPVSIRFSIVSFNVRLEEAETMYAFLTETGRNPNRRRRLGNVVIPNIQLRLKERSNLWLELPDFIKRLVGEPPATAVKFVIDIASLRAMLRETADINLPSSSS